MNIENTTSFHQTDCTSSSSVDNDGFEFVSYAQFFCFLVLVCVIYTSFQHSSNHRPDELPVVPYIVPWVGSMLGFQSNIVSFLSHWSKQLKSSVFSMHMAGKKAIVVLDPVAASLVVNCRFPQLSWSHMSFNLVRDAVGASKEAAKLYSNNRELHSLFERLIGNSTKVDKIVQSFHSMIIGKILPNLEEHFSEHDSNGWKNIELFNFFGKVLYFASVEVLFGFPSLANEEFFNLSLIYDRKIKAFVGKPRVISSMYREEYQARETIVMHIKSLISQYKEKASFSELVNAIIDKYQDRDIDGISRYLLLIEHASIINTMPMLFWVVYHILADKSAYHAARSEVFTIFHEKIRHQEVLDTTQNDHILLSNTFTLSELDQMECLDSIVMEALRLRNTQKLFRSRIANSDFEMKLPINGHIKKISVKKGNLVMTSPTLTHLDEEIFEDPQCFKWDRFLRRADGTLPVFTKNGVRIRNAVDAFGGGPSLCPARKLAKAELKLIMACMLLKYDMKFPEDKVPAAPDLREKVGVSNGMPEHDISIQLRKRTIQSLH